MQNVKSICSFADFFSVLVWRKACLFFKQLDKVIHVLDAALSFNFLDRLRGHTQQENSFLDAFFVDKFCQRAAVFPMEQTGQIARIHI